MDESLRRYNLRNTKKKPQGVLLKLWEEEYSKVISNENRRIPLEKVKTAIRSAFEDGMFEQWRITLKCPLSGQRIRVPARYADCTHIECYNLEAFLRMKTQKNLLVCPICQKAVEKPLANLRIDKYIETVLSTLPDAMQVEVLPDGSFTEFHEEFVVESNVISDEEPFVQDSNAPSFDIKQEALEEDNECITLSDGEDESIDEIAEMKPISLMPLNIDIKPEVASPSEQTDAVPKLKISKVKIDICYGTASFQTSEGRVYDDRPLSEYVSILRGSEADVHGFEAHIGFWIWSRTKLRGQGVLGSRETFEQFSKDAHSVSRLWQNGRIFVELYPYSDKVKSFPSIYDVCNGLFGQNRSILKCKILEINWHNKMWPFSVITNVVHHCNQLILKIQQDSRQKLHQTFLDILYTVTLPRHLDVTLKFNYRAFGDITDELEKRFQGSKAQYFKFKLFVVGFPRNKLLRNDYGTLEIKIVASHRDHSGLRIDTVIIEQRPHTSVLDQK